MEIGAAFSLAKAAFSWRRRVVQASLHRFWRFTPNTDHKAGVAAASQMLGNSPLYILAPLGSSQL